MQKRCLGQSGIEVSVVGLGTVKFGRNQGVKYPSTFHLPSDQAIEQLLATAAELGINLLDTAPAYGSSEERLGKLLQGKRQDWILSTKAGEEFVDGQSYYDFSADKIQKSIERSLKRLHTDYLDIVLIHSNGEDERLIHEEGVFETLQALKATGKIRAYGMSTKTVAGGLLTIDHADLAMVTYNPAYKDEHEVIVHAKQKQKGIFIKKAFASGHLATLGLQNPISETMQFLLAEEGITSIILGTINPMHLRENVLAAE